MRTSGVKCADPDACRPGLTGDNAVKHIFDEEVDRRGTNAVKWEFVQGGDDLLRWEHTDDCFGPNRILPMWVADMDFRCPEPVVKALVERAQHGIYGYTAMTDACYQPFIEWIKRRQGWEIRPEWICTTPGVVPALNMLVRTFASPGDRVIVQPPVYYPFYGAIENNGAELATNPLTYENGKYSMDFKDLEAKARDPSTKMVILCSPHNPVGRVWTRDELLRFGEICLGNDVLVVSDEIHGDLIYRGVEFTSFARLGDELARRSIICTAPSKTFNMAGLHTSCIVVPDEELRTKFAKTLQSNGLFGAGTFGIVALEAAYKHGEEWLNQVREYIEANYRYLEAYVREQIPEITAIKPEGTYLVWLDCRRLGLEAEELQRLMLDEARVYLDEGFIFGSEGEGFERINIACPRSILIEALDRIKGAIERWPGIHQE